MTFFFLSLVFVLPTLAYGAQRDLQGTWTNATITPFERPVELRAKEFWSEKEAKELESRAADNRVDRPPQAGDTGSYNQFWFDSGTNVVKTRRTSLVIEPKDGRVPLKPEAEAKRDYNPPTRRLVKIRERVGPMHHAWRPCRNVSRRLHNAYQITQTPGYVVILYEMIHEARIIQPTDGRIFRRTWGGVEWRLSRALGRGTRWS
jgi:hypothetical protein